MKLSCDMVQDLLPLVAEGLASGDSRAAVEAHLEECEDCRRALKELKEPPVVPAEEERGMESIRREIGKRRGLAVGCAVLLVCSMFCWFANWLTSPIYLDESVITAVKDNGDGTATISMDAAAAGRKTFQFEIDPSPAGETFVIWTSRWLEMTWSEPIPRPFTITRSVTHNGIYLFTGREGEEDLLIYENPEKFVNGGVMTLPRLVLGYYFRLSLGAGAVLLAAAWLFRRKRFAKYLWGLGSMSWCYGLCQGVICGFSFNSFFAQQEFAWAVVMTVCLWGAGICGWSMRKKR